MNQSRRNFLRLGKLAPLAAFPVIGASAWALVESNRSSRLLEHIQMTKDHVAFQNCSFQIGRDFTLRGNGQLLTGCYFTGMETGIRFETDQPTILQSVKAA
jgi:hypothetical protein